MSIPDGFGISYEHVRTLATQKIEYKAVCDGAEYDVSWVSTRADDGTETHAWTLKEGKETLGSWESQGEMNRFLMDRYVENHKGDPVEPSGGVEVQA